jgi:steroid delta-isomerase
VLTLTTTFPNGMKSKVHGIFTYIVNEAGLLTNLRGHWSLDEMKIEKPS